MKIPASIENILKDNNWNEVDYMLTGESRLRKIKVLFQKVQFPVIDTMLEQIALFHKMVIKFITKNNDKCTISFCTDKIKHFRPVYLNELKEVLRSEAIFFIADIHPAYFSLWINEKGYVWAVFEDIAKLCGENLFECIENIVIKQKINL